MNRLLKVTMLTLCLLWLFQIHTNSSWPEETANAHSSIIKPFSSQKVLCLKYSPFLEKIFCLKILHRCDGEDILSCKATTFLVMDMHGETLLEKQGLLTVPDAILTDDYRWPNNSAKVYFFKYTYLEKPELEKPEDEYIALYSFDTENGKMERVSPEGLYVLDYDLNPENGSLLLQGYYIENIYWGGGSAARKNSQLYLISLRQAGVVLKLDLPEKIAVSDAAVGTDDSILYFSHQKGVTDLVKMSISHPDLKETLWKTQEPILYQSVEWSSSKEKFLYLYCDSCSTEILDNWMEALAFASLQGVSSTIYRSKGKIKASWSPHNTYIAFTDSNKEGIGIYNLATKQSVWAMEEEGCIGPFDWLSDTELICAVARKTDSGTCCESAIVKFSFLQR